LVGRLDSPAPNDGVLKDYIRETLSDADLMDIFEYKKSDIENKYLNNKEFTSKNKGPGIRSQKELFVILNFAVWKKVYRMTL
jgi:hypothetical protein